MITATRALPQPLSWRARLMPVNISWHSLLVSGLLVLVLTSAVAVVYVRGLDRNLVSEQQNLLQQRQQLQVQGNQLLLERGTWSNPIHVQQVASRDGMVTPIQGDIKMVEM